MESGPVGEGREPTVNDLARELRAQSNKMMLNMETFFELPKPDNCKPEGTPEAPLLAQIIDDLLTVKVRLQEMEKFLTSVYNRLK